MLKSKEIKTFQERQGRHDHALPGGQRVTGPERDDGGVWKLWSDPKTAPRAMQAMLKMVKFDMAKLKEAVK